jgi:exodeoxyribonuclease VII small subunit
MGGSAPRPWIFIEKRWTVTEPSDRDKNGEPGLEARLRRLEEIVAELETEDLELDRALGLFEEGVGHVKEAGRVLAEAKLRVEELLDESEEEDTRPLEREP